MSTHTYALFIRLNIAHAAPSTLIVERFRALDQCISEVLKQSSEFSLHKGVEGRVILIPNLVRDALDFARLLLDRTAASGLSIQIGITHGRIQKVEDASGDNVAGDSVNRAARLAFIENPETRIAVDRNVFEDAQSGTDRYSGADTFSSLHEIQVKRTTLLCHWLHHPPVEIAKVEAPNSELQSELAHVVVYDIERFSELSHADMGAQAFELNRAVNDARNRRGKSFLGHEKFFHASAGDGGALAFSSLHSGGHDAWAFAKDLLDLAAGRTPIRIGITTGQIVINADGIPVGPGVFKANALSGRPDAGGACVNRRFWTDILDEADRRYWHAEPCDDDPEALIISAQKTASAPHKTALDGTGQDIEADNNAQNINNNPELKIKPDNTRHSFNSLTRKNLKKYAYYFLFIVLAHFLYSNIDVFGVNNATRNHSSDLYYKIISVKYPRHHQDNIAVVLLDGSSLTNLGSRWPASYDFHAAILDRIGRFNPRAIMVDLLFLDDRSDTDDTLGDLEDVLTNLEEGRDGLEPTRVFLATLTADSRASEVLAPLKKRTFSAAVYWRTDGPNSKSPLFYPLATGAGRTGNDASAAYRLYRHLCSTGDELCGGQNAGKPHFRNPMQIYWGAIPTDHPFIPSAKQDCAPVAESIVGRWLQWFTSPNAAFLQSCSYTPELSAFELLNGDDADVRRMIEGRVIFYGAGFPGQDEISSPVHGKQYGVFLHAMALDNLLTLGSRYHRWDGVDIDRSPAGNLFQNINHIQIIALLIVSATSVSLIFFISLLTSKLSFFNINQTMFHVLVIVVDELLIFSFILLCVFFLFSSINLGSFDWIGLTIIAGIPVIINEFIHWNSRNTADV